MTLEIGAASICVPEPVSRLLDAMRLGFALLSADGVVRYCNDYFAALAGSQAREVIGRDVSVVLNIGSDAVLRQLLDARSYPAQVDLTCQRPDGTTLPIALRFSCGAAVSADVCVVAVDITHRVAREANLHERLVAENAALAAANQQLRSFRLAALNMMTDTIEAKTGLESANRELHREIKMRTAVEDRLRRLATAVEQAAEGMMVTDVDGHIVYVNPAFQRMTGLSEADAIGQTPRILKSGVHGDEFYADLWSTIAAGEVWRGRLTNRRKDGTLYQEDATISAVRDPSGAIVNYVAVQRDVTRELELEAEFRQAQRMEAVGRLAGGVAHDFNNILTAILGYTEMVLAGTADPELREYAGEIRTAGERAAALTRQLLAFSRKQVIEPRLIDVNEVLASLKNMLRRLIGEDIRITINTAPDLWSVRADPSQIEQIVLNLVVNARDAMPDGGTLQIATRNVHLEAGSPARRSELPAGDWVLLSIADSGCGMTDDIRSRIFEPFFTTKEPGQGTGLGLATVFGIVTQAGGSIDVETALGRGTTLFIHLPRASGNTQSLADRAPVSVRGSETVLLVEDDERVRRIATSALRDRGFVVLAVASGDEAMQVIHEHSRHLDLMLTDLVMPSMNGRALVEHARSARPQMKLLCMSGYVDQRLLPTTVDGAPLPFLQKPFTPAGLAAKIREVLDRT